MTDDIVARLRGKYCCDGINTCNCDESADEIERLKEREEQLKRTLRAIEDIVKVRMYRGRTEPFLMDIQRTIHAALNNQFTEI